MVGFDFNFLLFRLESGWRWLNPAGRALPCDRIGTGERRPFGTLPGKAVF